MNLGEFRTKFKSRLNRSDCTDADALDFIDEGIKRVHRELRVRLMERVGTTLTADANSRLTIPDDYLEMKALWPADGTKQLIKKSHDDFLRYDAANGSLDVVYERRGGYWYLKPTQDVGAEFTLDYYGKTALDTTDTNSEDPLLDEAWDLFLYAALTAAANHFEDDREAKWDAQYKERLMALNDQADDQDLSEGVQTVQPGTSTEY